jgi:hypothetical protein
MRPGEAGQAVVPRNLLLHAAIGEDSREVDAHAGDGGSFSYKWLTNITWRPTIARNLYRQTHIGRGQV